MQKHRNKTLHTQKTHIHTHNQTSIHSLMNTNGHLYSCTHIQPEENKQIQTTQKTQTKTHTSIKTFFQKTHTLTHTNKQTHTHRDTGKNQEMLINIKKNSKKNKYRTTTSYRQSQ